MNHREAFMLRWLPREWVPFDVLNLLYGIQREDDVLWGHFRGWADRLRRPREVIRAGEISRHAFESYLQKFRLLPLTIAASHLGLSQSSFVEALDKLDEKGIMSTNTIDFSEQVFYEPLLNVFRDLFPETKDTVFSDQSTYCAALHKALKIHLGIDVEPVFCVTSVLIGEDPPEYAYEYDCITGDPIGLRYQIWLDFKKPFSLRPDACSAKYYAENETLLSRFLLEGVSPNIPPELRRTPVV